MGDSPRSNKQHRRDSMPKTPLDYEILFPLTEEQASDLVFPPGCRVCFDHTTLTANKHVFEASEGIVTTVSMGKDPSKPTVMTPVFIFNVETIGDQGVKSTKPFLSENLTYAHGCPVYLTVDDNNKKIEAEIAFSQKVAIDSSRGQTTLHYYVVSREGGRVRTEKGVKSTRVSYRKVEGAEVTNTEISSCLKSAASNENKVQQLTDAEVPQEIVSNQMDSLSETLTDVQIPDSSQEQNDLVANIPIKEEPIGDEIMQASTIDEADTFRNDPVIDSLKTSEKVKLKLAATVTTLDAAGETAVIRQGQENATHSSTNDERQSSLHDTRTCDPDTSSSSKPTASKIGGRWRPPTPTSTPNVPPLMSGPAPPRQTKKIYECKISVPRWLYESKGCQELFHHLIGPGGCKTSKISKETSCKVYIAVKSIPMHIVVTATHELYNPDGVERAGALIKESLVEYLNEHRSKNRLRHELATSVTRNYDQCQFPNTNSSFGGGIDSLEIKGTASSLSAVSGTIRGRDDEPVFDGRPKKLQKKDMHELFVPRWVTNGKRGLFLHIIAEGRCRSIESATDCKVDISKLDSEEYQMKILIEATNEYSRTKMAKDMLLDSITDFIGDENTSARLMCEIMSPYSTAELTVCSNPNTISIIDPNYTHKFLWAQILDLPYDELSKQYHGKFLLNEDNFSHVQREGCSIKVYGSFGLLMNYPCKPYVLIYGPKKANVIQAVSAAKQAMQRHQTRCQCEPVW